jgi:hypothetical protein
MEEVIICVEWVDHVVSKVGDVARPFGEQVMSVITLIRVLLTPIVFIPHLLDSF